MKRNLLLTCLFALIVLGLTAQNYTVDPNPAFGEANLDDLGTNPEDIKADAFITNNTNDTLNLRWERIGNERPEGWETAICDVNLCYLPNTTTKDFMLLPNESGGDMLCPCLPGRLTIGRCFI